MILYFEVIKGPNLGKKFNLKPGIRIGRTTGEILLNDKKVSGLHAQVELNESGHLILVDQGSSNGLVTNGNQVKKVVLLPGIVVQIGRSFLRVVTSPDELKIVKNPAPLAPQPPKDWRKALDFWISQISLQDSPTSNSSVLPFDPAIKLTLIQGLQADKEVTFGFGPRKVGSECFDLELYEESVPDVAFELFPEGRDAVFRTLYPEVIWLNEQSISKQALKDGDTIRIGKSVIRVNYVEFKDE